TAGTEGGHEYLAPDLFEAETPCGHYQGVTDQVSMSVTPGFYDTPLVPRGASKAEWLARQQESDLPAPEANSADAGKAPVGAAELFEKQNDAAGLGANTPPCRDFG